MQSDSKMQNNTGKLRVCRKKFSKKNKYWNKNFSIYSMMNF